MYSSLRVVFLVVLLDMEFLMNIGYYQARREPQRGPGSHSCGPMLGPITTSFHIGAKIEMLKASRGRKHGEGFPLSVVSSPAESGAEPMDFMHI